MGKNMEDKLFYAYLKYQQEGVKKVWSNLLKLHWSVLVSLIVSVAFTVGALVLILVLPLCVWHWICIVVMALGYISLIYTTERFQIQRCYERFTEYCEYCAELKAWLEEFSIDSKEKVANIKDRISMKISNLGSICEKSAANQDKWLQGFATPIVIAVITAVIAGTNATEEKIASTLLIIMIFGLGWYAFSIGAKMLNYISKKKIEQLECFASDLQGILDTQFEGGIAYQNKADIGNKQC